MSYQRLTDDYSRHTVTVPAQERTPVSDAHAEIRPEIRDMVLDAGASAVKASGGSNDTEKLVGCFESMTHVYGGRYPVTDLLREMQAATAEHLSKKAGNNPSDLPDPHQRQLWKEAIRHAADQATERHFQKAKAHFAEGTDSEAAEELCSAINCQVAAIAAERGWPHRTLDDIDNAVTALGTGKLPQDGDSIRDLLESASEMGDELNSAFAAARGQPGKATDRLFHEDSKEYREAATFFAERTIELANLLAGESQ